LTGALRGGKAAKERITWTADMTEVFNSTKQALAKAALLAHPSPGAEIALMVDASSCHVGASLQQRSSAPVAWQTLGFFSKKLDASQRRYSVFGVLQGVIGLLFRNPALSAYAGGADIHRLYRPQTFNLRPQEGNRCMDPVPAPSLVLRRRIHG
jgi:hypothetical protein